MTPFPLSEPVLVLLGPTAIGKTALSLQLATIFACEIVSMDSMQVYRHMDIGTAKATPQERRSIPHHLIDIVDPDEDYDANRFVNDACRVIEDIHARKKIPLLTGGTGLYLRALTEGLFSGGQHYPELRAGLQERLAVEGCSVLHKELMLCDRSSAERIHPNDTHRLLRALEIYYGSGTPWSTHLQLQDIEKQRPRFARMLKIGLCCPRDQLYERINRRCEAMIQAGLELEVRGLLEAGYDPRLKSMQSIGYRHMVKFIENTWNKREMEQVLARDTRRYAKRQFTWFNATAEVHWFQVDELSKILHLVADWLKNDNAVHPGYDKVDGTKMK